MEPFHLAILVLFPLLQVPAVLYLSRFFEVEEPPPRAPEFRSAADESIPATGTCPRCGEPNDPGYTYCRGCVARLGS